ncbi:hypothetical protein [Flavobacterium lacus]|uniref:Outer membrane lipoprotein carrier protein LolA n=1 Tax=Flavobacterium lacus TaxID=1353778 RepID=A0A328WXA3_9FLAO|nr:hypothetical protein [Flavobacterium lacus]RAR50842.1 hypothetical protein B0I10_1017 [Flavobacterium lacus]
MKLKFAIFFLLLFVKSFSQNFEGEIVYKNVCKSNKPDWKIEYCQLITDSIQNFYYKNGSYKYSHPKNENWTIFKQKENKIYTKTKKGKIFWKYTNSYNDSIVNVTINKKVLNILGYDCDELILETISGIQKYYYNSKLSINPELYKNHKYGNLYSITLITKSIPLKTIFIIESQGLVLESTAIKLDIDIIDKKIFLIPKNIEIEDGNF